MKTTLCYLFLLIFVSAAFTLFGTTVVEANGELPQRPISHETTTGDRDLSDHLAEGNMDLELPHRRSEGWEPSTTCVEDNVILAQGQGRDSQSAVSQRGEVVWIAQAEDGDDMEVFYSPDGSALNAVRVTYNDVDDWMPDVDAGIVAWYRLKDGNQEIFFANVVAQQGVWSASDPIQITDNDVPDVVPVVDDGLIAWTSGEQADGRDIHSVDLRRMPLEVENISQTGALNGELNRFPSIENGRYLWRNGPGGQGTYQLFENGVVTDVSSDGAAQAHLDGDQIAIVDHDGNDFEVYLYDIPTAQKRQMTDNDYMDWSVSLSNGKMVWTAAVNSAPANPTAEVQAALDHWSGWEIFFFDGNSVKQLTATEISASGPLHSYTGVKISNDQIVYSQENIVATPQEQFVYVATLLGEDSVRRQVIASSREMQNPANLSLSSFESGLLVYQTIFSYDNIDTVARRTVPCF